MHAACVIRDKQAAIAKVRGVSDKVRSAGKI
jgi:hypothetical protein